MSLDFEMVLNVSDAREGRPFSRAKFVFPTGLRVSSLLRLPSPRSSAVVCAVRASACIARPLLGRDLLRLSTRSRTNLRFLAVRRFVRKVWSASELHEENR